MKRNVYKWILIWISIVYIKKTLTKHISICVMHYKSNAFNDMNFTANSVKYLNLSDAFEECKWTRQPGFDRIEKECNEKKTKPNVFKKTQRKIELLLLFQLCFILHCMNLNALPTFKYFNRVFFCRIGLVKRGVYIYLIMIII